MISVCPVFPFLAVLVSFQLDFTMQKPSPEEAKILRMHGKSGFSAVSRMRMIFADCIWKQIFPRQRRSPALPDRDPGPCESAGGDSICYDTYVVGENCWFVDQCDIILRSYDEQPAKPASSEPGEACSNQTMFLNREDGWSFPIESPDETTKIVEREGQNEDPMSFQFCTGPQL